MMQILGEDQGGERQGHGDAEGPVMGELPPGVDRDLGGGRGRQRGGYPSTGTSEDVGTRNGVQGRAVEDSGRRVQAKPRWVALCTGRRGGEQVK